MLRHRGVFGDMPEVDRSTDELATLRKFMDPIGVEFRRDGDTSKVVDVVKSHRYVEVTAAVGAGKSTRIPLLLSKAMGCLVIHTIPFHIAAQHLATYLMSTPDGDKFVYMDDLKSDMPTHGVVLMSTPFFHARRAYDNFRGVDNAVLYLDESHESDGWTVALRTVAPAIKSFRCVVKATATSGPGMQLTPTLPAKREIRKYRKVDVSTWSASDRGVPWAASAIRGNTFICVDREPTRLALAAQYREHGFTVRDCCREDHAYFQQTLSLMKDPREGIVIALVDYKYRSSLTLPASLCTLIDSCEVAVPAVVDGLPAIKYRYVYDTEAQQYAGRGGRVAGGPVIVWQHDEKFANMMCDAESLEIDAANLLYRMMGFRPPLDFVEYPFFKGDVPVNIAAAMASDHPLRLCPPSSLEPWVNGHIVKSHDQQPASFEYDTRVRKTAKPVSCHTVVDADRPPSPPPPVPGVYRRTRVDVDGLDEYKSSRDSSPSTVFTLDTEQYDHITAIRAATTKPKRVAQRVLDARAAEAAASERKKTEQRLSGEPSPIMEDISTLAGLNIVSMDTQIQKRALTTDSAVVHAGSEPVAAIAPVSSTAIGGDFEARGNLQPVYSVLAEREDRGFIMHTGKYYHYSGMQRAPEVSGVFLRGVESVVMYCEAPNARQYVKGLPEMEKLYALRVLIDASNDATAVAVGMQRLFHEVSGRPPEEWHAIVDHTAMMEEVEWMIAQCTDQQARVRVYHSIIPWFARYDLDEISAPLELEQRVMLSVMERFERVAVKKDPDKAHDYWQRLNGRVINVGPRLAQRAVHRQIDYG